MLGGEDDISRNGCAPMEDRRQGMIVCRPESSPHAWRESKSAIPTQKKAHLPIQWFARFSNGKPGRPPRSLSQQVTQSRMAVFKCSGLHELLGMNTKRVSEPGGLGGWLLKPPSILVEEKRGLWSWP